MSRSNKYQAMRPSYEDEDSDDGLDSYLAPEVQQSDDFESLSFGALSSAHRQLESKNDDSDSDSGPEESGSKPHSRPQRGNAFKNKEKQKQKHKHAPAESSAKKPVSRIREIPGLETKKESNLYQDIRFNAAYGKADLHETRKNYAFLDEYRQKEINSMESILKDRKNKLSPGELEDIKGQLMSLKSRMKTLQNRDLEHKVLQDHRRQQNERISEGKQVNKFYLKRSDQRKLIQKTRFDQMKKGQVEKVMERKRKKRLGKEFRQMEYRTRE